MRLPNQFSSEPISHFPTIQKLLLNKLKNKMVVESEVEMQDPDTQGKSKNRTNENV